MSTKRDPVFTFSLPGGVQLTPLHPVSYATDHRGGSGSQTCRCCGPIHYTQNRCGPLRFVKVFSIIGKIDWAVSEHEHLNRPGKKQISGFGLPPIDITKIK